MAKEAWPALAERLAQHEAAGTNPTDLVRTAGGHWEGADSLARVLHHRIGPPADGPWTFLPATGGDSAVRAWAQRHLELIEQRIDHLTDQATTGQPHWLPEHLHRPAGDERAEADWLRAVRTVVAYRDQYGVTGTDPLGPRPQQGRAGQDHDRAAAALARMEGSTRSAPRAATVPTGAQDVDQPTAAERIRRLRERGEEGRGSDGDELSSRELLAQARGRRRQQQDERRRAARRPEPPQHGSPRQSGPHL